MVLRTASLLLAAGFALAVANPASAQKQTLRMAYWAGPSHHMVKTQADWVKTIETASGGNIAVEIDKAPLAKPPGQYDLVKDGVRDMVWHVPAYTPGRFDLLTVAEIPFICPNATVCAPALWNWYTANKLDQKEFTDTKPLVVFMHGPGGVHTTKPVKTLADIKGMKMRVGGAGVAIAKALDMTAVAMAATEAHEALQRGTVEGVLFPWEAMESFRLTEMVKYHLEIPGGMYAATFFININPKSFGRLAAANQAALIKASGAEGSRLFGRGWDGADKVARENAVKRGNSIQTIAPDELNRWRPMLEFVREGWLKSAKERGVDGPKLLRDFEDRVKAAAS
jgi:TRAP-type C4-dicarboxylate transport system substrate-binding protein